MISDIKPKMFFIDVAKSSRSSFWYIWEQLVGAGILACSVL